MKKSKILVFTYGDSNSHHGCSFNELLKTTNFSKEEYCKIHSYDFYCRTENIRTDRPIGWEKIQIICDFIDKYDYIFYVECDAAIVNHTIKLENLIDDNYDLTFGRVSNTKDYIQINSGVFLIKCSEWSKHFFKKLNSEEVVNKYPNEQECIISEINSDIKIRNHFRITHLRFFNSYNHEWHPEDNYQHGDFILHLAGSSNAYRQKVFEEINQNLIKLNNYRISCKPFLNIGDENCLDVPNNA
jgi:hypothetical protein